MYRNLGIQVGKNLWCSQWSFKLFQLPFKSLTIFPYYNQHMSQSVGIWKRKSQLVRVEAREEECLIQLVGGLWLSWKLSSVILCCYQAGAARSFHKSFLSQLMVMHSICSITACHSLHTSNPFLQSICCSPPHWTPPPNTFFP